MPDIRTDLPYPVRVIENLFVPMPDGTRLAAKLWLPEGAGEGAGAVPAIVEYIPYRKRDGTRYRDQGLHGYLAGHGYACVRLDIRGSGDSDGLIDDEYTVQEQLDGCDAIAWLAAQDWCDGKVAMIGISWGGFNGLQIAARQPPALRTVITVGSTDDRYATDIHWVGGCLSKDNFDWSATMMATNDLPPDPEIVGPRWREMWRARIEHQRPWIIDWLRHQRRDGFWKQGSVCEDFDAIKVPVYAVSGWADNYSESVPRLLAGLKVPRRGLVGPWAHSYPHDVTVEPAIGWLQEVIRWCDHWLKGRDTAIMDEPMYRVWMQDSVPPATCYLSRPGRWVSEESWPSPRIELRRMPLGADGSLSGLAGPRSICSPLWVGLNSGEIGRYGEDADWPGDQREDDGGSLVFLSDPLPEAIEILGAPRIALTFSADKPCALVAARLNDVWPDGRSARVALGILNLTHRDSHEHPTPLEPGRTYDTVVEMDDIAHRFPAGHRIAVALSTAYYPLVWPSPELATLTVSCGASELVLPVRPPRAEDGTLRQFDAPQEAAQTPVTHLAGSERSRRRIVRDLLSGAISVDFPRWNFAMEMTDIGQTQISSGTCRHEIVDGDPLTAATHTDNRVEIRWKDRTIVHHSTGSLTCDATHFVVRMQVRLTENGDEVFARDWDERIPRDLI